MNGQTELWAINSRGKVFTLSTSESHWKSLKYCGIDLKKLSTCLRFTWAIGGDHQVYLYVESSDVPIRVKEEAYENQRWNPYDGFTDKLLPSDRFAWSSKDGSKSRQKSEICLPSASWIWENSWYLETSIDGQPLGKEGWTFAIDFPRHYSQTKKWNSCVRRRKWLRYRKFIATESWTLIPGINEDPTAEPFIDICCGGAEIPGADSDVYVVWGVTIHGRVVFRSSVNSVCPEGQHWIHVMTPPASEVNHLFVGPTGLVWAITWDGDALIRCGVTRHNMLGTDWIRLSSECKLDQISLGLNSVWAVCRNHKVWFRTGIRGLQCGEDSEMAVGTGWVEMVGEMCTVSVGINDQVFAVGYSDRDLYFRTNVTLNELSGRTWKQISLPFLASSSSNSSSELNLSIATTCDVAASRICSQSSEQFDGNVASGASTQFCYDSMVEFQNSESDEECFIKNRTSSKKNSLSRSEVGGNQCRSNDSLPVVATSDEDFPTEIDRDRDLKRQEIERTDSSVVDNQFKTSRKSNFSSLSSYVSDTVADFVNDVNEFGEVSSLRDLQNTSLPENVQDEDSVNDLSSEPWMNQVNDPAHYIDDQCSDFSWFWICSQACCVDPQNLPPWFYSGNAPVKNCINKPWRINLMHQLENRYSREIRDYVGIYEEPVKKSKWVKTTRCKIWLENKSQGWFEGSIELERQNSDRGVGLEKSNLTCTYNSQRPIVVGLQQLTCIFRTFLPSHSGLSLFTSKGTIKQQLMKLSFRSNNEMEDWLASIYVACIDLRKTPCKLDARSALAISAHGDVYAHDPLPDMETSSASHLFWRLLGGGHLASIESCCAGVVWGIGYDSTAWVYTGGYGGSVYKGLSGYNADVRPIRDTMKIYIYENQRWNPLTGFSVRGLPTDRYGWSDQSGLYECTKQNTELPSVHWTWSTDWNIDYKTPGGVDNEGWQYAYDFPRIYHGHKGFTDYVRRRRWYRKCKLSSSGPWKELGKTPLIAVSVQVDHGGVDSDPVSVWAIANNGDALCRLGVTSRCPEGTSWEHVPADQPFLSISIGGNHQVWVVARDGSAFLRHGITRKNIIGDVWFHLEPPQSGTHLRQISAGIKTVMAIDNSNKLWSRQEIMPHFPEGTSWKYVSSNIQQVSVGPQDQIWAIMSTLQISSSTVTGVMCHRTGVTDDEPSGDNWDYGISGGWQYICVRGCVPDRDVL